MTTSELRKSAELSRKDAVRCNKAGGDVAAYKSSPEFQERAKRRAKQGNGLGNPPRNEGWVADWVRGKDADTKLKKQELTG